MKKIIKLLLSLSCLLLELIPALVIVYFKRIKLTAKAINHMLDKNDEDTLEVLNGLLGGSNLPHREKEEYEKTNTNV